MCWYKLCRFVPGLNLSASDQIRLKNFCYKLRISSIKGTVGKKLTIYILYPILTCTESASEQKGCRFYVLLTLSAARGPTTSKHTWWESPALFSEVQHLPQYNSYATLVTIKISFSFFQIKAGKTRTTSKTEKLLLFLRKTNYS